MPQDYPMTPDTIQRAKQSRDAERAAITQATGVRFSEDGRPLPIVIGCPYPGCAYAASALGEGRALRSLGSHIVKAHWKQKES